MTGEWAIEVHDLYVEYYPIRRMSIVKNLLHKNKRKRISVKAVNHLSFSVQKGEILGVVGMNGSGKSTLLRALAGILQPDAGTIDLKGNSLSLLSIGVGFNVEMTGRENVILSGMLLGFDKKEIEARMDEIISFAEIEDFIDMPVKTYSSGMYSKLAFSITANLKTDIMLIDEVLSVGDEHFQKKSISKMKELILDKNRTVIIVSHTLPLLQEFCDQVMWLHDGTVRDMGDPAKIIDCYRQFAG